MYQPTPGIPYQEPNITVMGQRLQTVENLAYLGSTLSRSANMDAEVNNRIAKATSAFWKMDEDSLGKKRYLAAKQNQSLQSSRLKSTSLRLWTWIIYGRQEKQLQQFHLRCLRSIFKTAAKTKSPTPRCWRGRNSLASLPPCARHRHDGRVTSFECQTPVSPSSCCMVKSVVVEKRSEHSASATKIL